LGSIEDPEMGAGPRAKGRDNDFRAGSAMKERSMSEASKSGRTGRAPQGEGLIGLPHLPIGPTRPAKTRRCRSAAPRRRVTAEAALPPADLAAARRRGTLAAALRLGEDAAAELALIPDTAELRRRDDALLAGDDTATDGVEAQIGRLVEEYRNGRALDLFTASPTELLACCVARAGAV
jgi:hypothetical protein